MATPKGRIVYRDILNAQSRDYSQIYAGTDRSSPPAAFNILLSLYPLLIEFRLVVLSSMEGIERLGIGKRNNLHK
jgi:hypothetical protein